MGVLCRTFNGKINAKQCLQDENSIFNHYKKLIDIRKNNDTIIYGD